MKGSTGITVAANLSFPGNLTMTPGMISQLGAQTAPWNPIPNDPVLPPPVTKIEARSVMEVGARFDPTAASEYQTYFRIFISGGYH